TKQHRVQDLCNRIWPGQPPPKGAEERDWSTLRHHAEALLKLVEHWRGTLPPAVARALTDPDTRNRLTATVQRHDSVNAAFSESWGYLGSVFDLNQSISTGITLEAAPLPDLQHWLVERVNDVQRLHEWVQFREIECAVVRAEVPAILKEVLAGEVKP